MIVTFAIFKHLLSFLLNILITQFKLSDLYETPCLHSWHFVYHCRGCIVVSERILLNMLRSSNLKRAIWLNKWFSLNVKIVELIGKCRNKPGIGSHTGQIVQDFKIVQIFPSLLYSSKVSTSKVINLHVIIDYDVV